MESKVARELGRVAAETALKKRDKAEMSEAEMDRMDDEFDKEEQKWVGTPGYKAYMQQKRRRIEKAGKKSGASKSAALSKSAKNWIQKAVKKPGALHKQLGVPEDKKIPAGKLNAAAKKGGKIGQRARLAKTLKKLGAAEVDALIKLAERGVGRRALNMINAGLPKGQRQMAYVHHGPKGSKIKTKRVFTGGLQMPKKDEPMPSDWKKGSGVDEEALIKAALMEWIAPKYYEAKALQNRAGQTGMWDRIKAFIAPNVSRAQAQEAINKKKGVGVEAPGAGAVAPGAMKAASYDIGRKLAATILLKEAADRDFMAITGIVEKLAKKAGLDENQTSGLVKKATVEKSAILLGGLGLGLGAYGAYNLGKNMGWWGQSKNPYVQRIQQLSEARDAAQKAGMPWLGPQGPGMGGAGGAGGMGGMGMDYSGGLGPHTSPAMAQLFSRAGYDPKRNRSMMDHIQALQFGGLNRMTRGKELGALARMGTGMGLV